MKRIPAEPPEAPPPEVSEIVLATSVRQRPVGDRVGILPLSTPCAPECGERLLVVAVLALAVEDLAGRTAGGRIENERSAREWIERGSAEPFGFAWTCHTLGLDPACVRARLLARRAA